MKTLLLIDANALVHRAFHALPPLTTKAGEPIGAIYGLASMLLKLLRELQPNAVAAAFDRPEPTFRKQLWNEYKAQRPKAPEELVRQIIQAHELFERFGVPVCEAPGFEADDIIATLVARCGKSGTQTVILTADLDALQLVSGSDVVVHAPKQGLSEMHIYTEEAVKERLGVRPEQVPDYKGLVGDPSDNIRGVPGVGPKTAAELLCTYPNLEALFATLAGEDPLTKKLAPYKEQSLFAKRLATLRKDAPVALNCESLAYLDIPRPQVAEYLASLGFMTLVKRLENPQRVSQETKKEQATLV